MSQKISQNLIDKAMEYATQKHQGQVRKGTNIPYIVHPYEVLQILRENGGDALACVGGVLHDTIEDTSATKEEIERLFGQEVAQVVCFESEDKSLDYKDRKYKHMMVVDSAPRVVKMINCADKLSNLRSIYLDYINFGEDCFKKFNGAKEDIKWYYGLSLKVLKELKNTKMYKQLKYYYKKVFKEKK